MKKALIVVVVLLALVVVGLFAVPPLLSWGFLKERVAVAVKQETGLDVEIGSIDLRLLPNISAEISDLRVLSPHDAPETVLASVAKVDFAMALLPLLGKAVEIDRLVVQGVALNLKVDETGQANWVVKRGGGAGDTKVEADPTTPSSDDAGASFPLSDLVLGDVRLEKANVSYNDDLSGQSIAISRGQLRASLPGLSGSLNLNGGMVVNEQQVTLDFALDSPEALLDGQAANLKSDLASPLLSLGADLRLQTKPQAAVDGETQLEILSVGELLDWLQRPLPADQPDPGSVMLASTFKTEGAKVILEAATLTGEALNAKASGSFDASGDGTKISLLVESDQLDIDRYLPPATKKTKASASPRREKRTEKPADDPAEGISDAPFDFSALRSTEADIRIVIGGIKAAGYEVGPIDFTAVATAGRLEANLVRLSLYGGDVTGKAQLDASGDTAALDARFDVSAVDLGALTAVGADGPAPVAGSLSANMTAAGGGASPRALVRDLKGGLAVQLGDVNLQNASEAALSGADLTVDLPGIAQAPSLKGSLVYNQEKVRVDVSLDPLDKVLAGDTFALKADVTSAPVSVSYDGRVQQQPMSGLDGGFKLDVPSVGKLAAWLGQPLPKGQPDPGPLSVNALLRADGGKVALEQAEINGDELSAQAKGSVEVGEEATKIALEVTGGFIDVDRYLPPPAKGKKAGKKSGAKAKRAAESDGDGNILAGISDEPIDLKAFKALSADIKIALEGIKANGLTVAPVNAEASAQDGVLTLNVTDLGLYGGTVTSHASLKDVKDSLDAELALNVGGLAIGELLKAAGQDPVPASGVAALALTAQSAGPSPRALVEGLVAELSVSLDQAALAALPDGEIDQLRLGVDLPGMSEAATSQLELLWNGEKLGLNLDMDTPQAALLGEAFGLRATLASDPLDAKVDGQVRQAPLPGFTGDLSADIGSIARLAAWLAQPLPSDQPDPGTIAFAAKLSSEDHKITVESLSLEGAELEASGNGFFDGAGEVAQFNGLLEIAKLDLNHYLPPDGSSGADDAAANDDGAAAGSGKKKKQAAAAGWSEKPFKLKALRQADGTIKINTGPVTYRKVEVTESATSVDMKGGVLTASIDKLDFAQGGATLNAVVDASKKVPGFSYKVALKDIESRPFLESFADIDWMSGRLHFKTKGKSKGRNEKEAVGNLNGEGSFKFKDGAIKGFDLAGTLRNAKALGLSSIEGSDRPETEFTELSGSYTTVNGLVNNPDLKMLAPLVRVRGAGVVDLPPRSLDYGVEAKLVASVEGQGGDDTLAGIPIPVRAEGPWDALSFNVDFEKALGSAVLNPDTLEKLPGDLGEAAKGLVIPGVTSGGGDGDSEGGGEAGLGGALNKLLGGGGDDEAATSGTQTKKKKKKKKKKAAED